MVAVREATPRDIPALEKLYSAAFPGEDLVPLLHNLYKESGNNGVVGSLVAVDGTEKEDIIGSIIFTKCKVQNQDVTSRTANNEVALLGPLCVVPSSQKQGYGGLLVRTGIQRMKETGKRRILVLGNPTFYGRFGFQADNRIQAPYAMPEKYAKAWQSLDLSEGNVDPPPTGTLVVPKAWQDKSLWE